VKQTMRSYVLNILKFRILLVACNSVVLLKPVFIFYFQLISCLSKVLFLIWSCHFKFYDKYGGFFILLNLCLNSPKQ
jgi:hypothetical protein